jgi:hypothetical protein
LPKSEKKRERENYKKMTDGGDGLYDLEKVNTSLVRHIR